MNKEEKCKELLEKIKQTPDNIIEEAIDSLSEKLNKEEIEKVKKHYIFTTEHELDDDNKTLKEYIEYLEQKEFILDKVTEYIENYIDDKQNEYEAISESYICQTDEDEYIKEKKLSIIKGQKQVLKNVLNIIEGEKK